MNEYMYLLAIVIGVLIAILLKRKDLAEILKLQREITKIDKEIHPHA